MKDGGDILQRIRFYILLPGGLIGSPDWPKNLKDLQKDQIYLEKI
jgi:hypothetical protein